MDTRLDLPKEIFPVKLSRPKLQQTYPRTRLFAILSQSVGDCALWICGPAGSGKTTLVNSFLDTAGIPGIWYSVDQTDTDIASFFYYMGKAWKEISSDTSSSLPFFTQEFFPKISVFTNRFFNLFSHHVPHPLAIVLDNYQIAGKESRLHEVLCNAIDILQGKIILIICSRTEPPAAFARSRANRTLRVLNWHHLRFQKKAPLFLSSSEHDALLVQTASILAEEKKSEDAINLYIRSYHFMKAMDLIVDKAPILVSQGRVQTIETWINAFPQEFFKKQPWLIFWKGACKIPTAPDQAKTLFQKALDIFEAQSDPAGCFMSLSGMLDAIAFQFNTFREFDRYFEKCRMLEVRFGIAGPPEVILKLTASMLLALLLRGNDPADIKKWSDRAWQVLHGTKDVNLALQIFSQLIFLRMIQGDLCAAEHLLKIFKGVTHKKTAPLSYITFLDLKIFHGWLSANFQKGLTAASQAMKVEKETGIFLFFLGLRVHAALCAMGLGRYDTAKKLLEEVTPNLSHAGLWNQSFYHYAFFWLHLLTENITDCRYHALAYFEKVTQSGTKMMLTSGHLLMAKMFYALGENRTAETHLKKSFGLCSRFGAVQDKFMALLTLTTFLLDKKAEARAEKTLRKALSIGRIWDYRYGFCWIPKEMARLCAHALRNDIEVKYVRTLIREHNLIPEIPPRDIPNWPWPISISSFGGFKIHIGEDTLRFSRKTQQKPMTMLKYMMAKGGTNVPEHTLLDALWPDSEGDAAYNAFKTTLHRLRKLLGSKNAIVHQQGVLAFNAFIVWTDTLAFASCCSRVDQELEKQDCVETALQLLNELLLLYRGAFIPEEQSSWVIPEREKLRSKFLSAIKKIADQLEHHGQWEQAINCCRQALEIDPLLESLYPRLMQTYVQFGRKTEALGIYRQCKVILRAELGTSPPEKMQYLKQSL